MLVHVEQPPGSVSGREDPAENQLSDDELMERVKRDDERAFETLVRRHQARLLRIAARYVGSSALAADALQNAFLEVHKRRVRYEARGQFRAYLLRIVINQCRMATRSKWHGALRVDIEACAAFLPALHGCDALVWQQALQNALQALNEKLRIVVILRYVDGLSLAEIALQLGLPVGTVKSRLFAGTHQLRTLLSELS